jgi:hypothetical protein
LLRNVGALIDYLLCKNVKRSLSVRPSPREALAWLMSTQRCSPGQSGLDLPLPTDLNL